MSGPARPPAIVLVSTADWDNPFWTNKQHVAAELARRGHAILYIESQGLRAPTATARDLGRAWRKLQRALSPPRRVADNLWVLAPLVVPLQRFGLVRALNRVLLGLSLIAARAWTGLDPKWLWTYSPLTTELYALHRYEAVIYHAVDDISAQPGMPREAIAAAEADLSRRADLVFATSPLLAERHGTLNPDTHFLPNVADFRHFSRALQPGPAPEAVAALPQPRDRLRGRDLRLQARPAAPGGAGGAQAALQLRPDRPDRRRRSPDRRLYTFRSGEHSPDRAETL